MSRSARLVVALATLVVLVVAFVVLQPDGDKKASTQTPTAPSNGTVATTTSAPATPVPEFSRIRVRDGKPVGGVQKIEVNKGDHARIEVSSSDTTDEIHVHGYDLGRDLKAGGKVRFSFQADADGIYEIELEHAGAQIGELVVSP